MKKVGVRTIVVAVIFFAVAIFIVDIGYLFVAILMTNNDSGYRAETSVRALEKVESSMHALNSALEKEVAALEASCRVGSTAEKEAEKDLSAARKISEKARNQLRDAQAELVALEKIAVIGGQRKFVQPRLHIALEAVNEVLEEEVTALRDMGKAKQEFDEAMLKEKNAVLLKRSYEASRADEDTADRSEARRSVEEARLKDESEVEMKKAKQKLEEAKEKAERMKKQLRVAKEELKKAEKIMES